MQLTPIVSTAIQRLVQINPFATLDDTFDSALCSLVEAFRAGGATLWVPRTLATESPGPVQMARTTFRLEDINCLPNTIDPLRMNQSIAGLDTRVMRAYLSATEHFYRSLDDSPSCSQPTILRQYGLESTWAIPLTIANLSRGQFDRDVTKSARLVITIDGALNAMPETLDENMSCLLRLICSLIERAVWADQELLDHQVLIAFEQFDLRRRDTMDSFCRDVARVLGFAACTMVVFESIHQVLRVAGTTGLQTIDDIDHVTFDLHDSGPVARVWHSGMPAIAEHPSELPSDGRGRNDKTDSSLYDQVLAVPIAGSHELSRTLGILRLSGKRVYRDGIRYPLNALDVLRAQKAASRSAPLVRFEQESEFRKRALKRLRHDQKTPSRIIRDVSSFWGDPDKPDSYIISHINTLRLRLQDVEALAETMLVLAELTRLSVEGDTNLKLRFDQGPHKLLSEIIVPIAKMIAPTARQEGLAKDKPVYYHADTFRSPDKREPFPPLFIDARMIRVALYNVIDNAIKYSHRDTQVELYGGIEQDNGAYCVYVRNYGIEVPAAERERIFEPYFRTEKAKDKDPTGTGMGLAFARSIMRRHGGDLILDSINPTAFKFMFPRSLQYRSPQ